jgi:hypothetical protein
LKWKVIDPSGAQMGAGPSVGPDGNIYAVTQDAGLPNGLGEITLSPAGQILSNRPGYLTGRGANFRTREIVFGSNQFYFVMNNVPDNTIGLHFFELGGNFLFARLAGGSDNQPAVDASGSIYSTIASNQLGVFDSSGNLLRSSFFSTLTAPSLGSDGTAYVGESFPNDILALNPDLSVKWKLANSIGYPVGPVVNSSNTLVVAGVNGIGVPSAVQGIDATTGKLSWQVNLPAENGGFVRPMSRARFSAELATVYVGMDVNDGAADVYTYLYAINTAPTVTLSSLKLNPTTVKGGTPSQATVTLSGKAPSGGAKVKLGSSNTAVATVPAMVTVPAGASSATFTVTTKPVSANTKVTISASYAGIRKNATLTVTP